MLNKSFAEVRNMLIYWVNLLKTHFIICRRCVRTLTGSIERNQWAWKKLEWIVRSCEKGRRTKEKSQVDVLAHSIDKVAHQYLNYIFEIHAVYEESTTEDKQVYKQKFDEVRT